MPLLSLLCLRPCGKGHCTGPGRVLGLTPGAAKVHPGFNCGCLLLGRAWWFGCNPGWGPLGLGAMGLGRVKKRPAYFGSTRMPNPAMGCGPGCGAGGQRWPRAGETKQHPIYRVNVELGNIRYTPLLFWALSTYGWPRPVPVPIRRVPNLSRSRSLRGALKRQFAPRPRGARGFVMPILMRMPMPIPKKVRACAHLAKRHRLKPASINKEPRVPAAVCTVYIWCVPRAPALQLRPPLVGLRRELAPAGRL